MTHRDKITVNTPSAIFAALILSAIGAIFYNTLPLFIGAAQDSRGWSDSDTGFLGASFFAGFTTVTISAFFWARRINWRTVCLTALPFACLPMIAAAYYQSYWLNILFVIISGGAFSAIYVVGTIAIGDTSNPPRWLGVKIGAETGLGGVFILSSSAYLIGSYGFSGLVTGLAIVAILALPFIYLMPSKGLKYSDENITSVVHLSAEETKSIWFALMATVIFFLGETAIWSFVERIGASSGYDPQTVGIILVASLGAAMTGALSEAAIGDRFGYRKAFFFAEALFVIGTITLFFAESISPYALGVMIVMYSVGFGVPVVVAAIAKLDRVGTYIVLSVPALGVGGMFGPGLAGVLLESFGTVGLLMLTIFTATISYALLQKAMIMGRKAENISRTIV